MPDNQHNSSQDPLTALDPAGAGDCGCGGGNPMGSPSSLPSVAELESALAAFRSGGPSGQLGGLSAELELAGGLLSDGLLADGLDMAAGESPAVGLDELVGLVERYPGLKITLSFA